MSLGVVFLLVFTYFYSQSGVYHLKPGEEIELTVKGNRTSLDANIDIQITSHTKNGEIKLVYDGDWYNADTDTHYNISRAQIEKWDFDSEQEKLVVTSLSNPLDGVSVDREGIMLSTPKDVTFGFSAKDDFTIIVKNLSNKSVTFEKSVIHR